MPKPVRGTQTLVDQMGWVFGRPVLVLCEVAWRWIFGVPFLYLCWLKAHALLTAIPPESTGLSNLDSQNPWVAVVQLSGVWAHYEPSVAAILVWLAPLSALIWSIASGIGRGIVLKRLEPNLRFRPGGMILLQAAWLAMLALIFAAWFRSIQWVAATHITPNAEADLVGYAIWAIFLSLGFFTLWALISWPLAMAPLLMLLENRPPFSAVLQCLRLQKTFKSKLMEINLVMGIIKLMLIVLAMVFAAAPLPFSDQLGPGAMRFAAVGSLIFFFIANDFFHVVKLKGFIEFWHVFRDEELSRSAKSNRSTSDRIATGPA